MTDNPNDKQEKKIFVDEDWKAKVQAEKEEALKREKPGQEAPQSASQAGPKGPLPPPSLEFLVSSLAMQTMAAMGLMANPATGNTEIQLDQAKHFIDTITMLQEKTEGNRTPQETAMMDNLLHELRLGYLSIQQKAGS